MLQLLQRNSVRTLLSYFLLITSPLCGKNMYDSGLAIFNRNQGVFAALFYRYDGLQNNINYMMVTLECFLMVYFLLLSCLYDLALVNRC